MTGNHFRLQRWEEDGLWHWELRKAHSPRGPIARSSQGYSSPSAARRSIQSACSAFAGASRGAKGPLIHKWESIRPK